MIVPLLLTLLFSFFLPAYPSPVDPDPLNQGKRHVLALFKRACDSNDPNSSACEKPVSHFLKSGVPAIICAVVFVIAVGVCAYFLWRNKRRDAREARAARVWND